MTATLAAPPKTDARVPTTPYVGLTPFTEGDAPFFFGREKERRIISANLLASRLTLLYGASGVGKSSIIRAGVQRDFRQKAEEALAEGSFPESIVVVFTGWRDDPVAGIKKAVSGSVKELLGPLAPRAPSRRLPLADFLVEWNHRLDEKALEHAGPEADFDEPIRTELLIVFDQFEQYFVYHRDEKGSGTFVEQFPDAVNREGLRASFLISLREDAYTQLDLFEGPIVNLFSSNLRIQHLDDEAAAAAIVKPVEKYNELLGNPEPAYRVETGLVNAVIKDVRAGNIVIAQAGGGVVEQAKKAKPERPRVETPFLQLVISRLWIEEQETNHSHVLRLSTLKKLGGAEEIVRKHLDEAMSEFDDDERAVAAKMFHQLVTPSGARIVHSARDLAGYANVSPKVAESILETLDEERILRTVDAAPGNKSQRFEIRHDVLASAVVEWNRKYEEAKRRAEDEERQRQELEEQRRQQRQELEEQRRRQRTRIAVRVSGGAIVGFLVAVALAALAWTARNHAKAEEHHSQSKELAAKAILRTADDPYGAVDLAVKARQKDTKGVEADGALRTALVQAPRVLIDQGARAFSGVTIYGAALSPDDKRLVTGSSRGTVATWDAETGAPLRMLKGKIAVLSVAFSPDGRRIVVARADGSAQILDSSTNRVDRDLPRQGGSVTSAAFSADGALVVTTSADGNTRVWQTATGRPAGALHEQAAVFSAAFGDGGKRLSVAGADGTVRVWEPSTGRRIVTLHPGGQVLGADLSRDGKLVVTAGDDGTARVWNATSGALEHILVGHQGPVDSAAFSPDGRFIVTGGDDATVRVWDERTGQTLLVLHGHRAPIGHVAFSDDGRLIVTSGDDGTARVWTAPERSSVRTLDPQPASGVAFGPDGTRVVTAGEGGLARIVNMSPGEPTTNLNVSGGQPLKSVAFSRDGRFFVTAGDDRTARVWGLSPPGARLLLLLRGHVSSIDDAEFDAKGDLVVTAGEDGTARIWNPATRRSIILRHKGQVHGASFSPNGKLVVTAVDDGTARIWDWQKGSIMWTLLGHQGAVNSATFSPDGRLVVTASDDTTARVWDATTGGSLLVLRGHTDPVEDAVFSPDGKFILTVSADGTARVWDLATGVTLAVLDAGKGPHRGAFSPDGKLVAIAGDQGTRLYACDVCSSIPGDHPLGVWPPIESPAG